MIDKKPAFDYIRFEYEFHLGHPYSYGSGKFTGGRPKFAAARREKYDEIMEVMLEVLREERRQTYSIFLRSILKRGGVMYVADEKSVNAKGSTNSLLKTKDGYRNDLAADRWPRKSREA